MSKELLKFREKQIAKKEDEESEKNNLQRKKDGVGILEPEDEDIQQIIKNISPEIDPLITNGELEKANEKLGEYMLDHGDSEEIMSFIAEKRKEIHDKKNKAAKSEVIEVTPKEAPKELSEKKGERDGIKTNKIDKRQDGKRKKRLKGEYNQYTKELNISSADWYRKKITNRTFATILSEARKVAERSYNKLLLKKIQQMENELVQAKLTSGEYYKKLGEQSDDKKKPNNIELEEEKIDPNLPAQYQPPFIDTDQPPFEYHSKADFPHKETPLIGDEKEPKEKIKEITDFEIIEPKDKPIETEEVIDNKREIIDIKAEIVEEKNLNDLIKDIKDIQEKEDKLKKIQTKKDSIKVAESLGYSESFEEKEQKLINEINDLKNECEILFINELKSGKSIDELKEELKKQGIERLDILENVENRLKFMDPEKVKENFSNELEYLMKTPDGELSENKESQIYKNLILMGEILGFADDLEQEKSKFTNSIRRKWFGKKNKTKEEIIEDKLAEIKTKAEEWTKRDLYELRISEDGKTAKKENKLKQIVQGFGKTMLAFKGSSLAVGGAIDLISVGAATTFPVAAVSAVGTFMLAAGVLAGWKKAAEWNMESKTKSEAMKEKIDFKKDSHKNQAVDNLSNLISLEQIDKLDPKKRKDDQKSAEMIYKYATGEIDNNKKEEFLQKKASKEFKKHKKENKKENNDKIKAILALKLAEERREAETAKKVYKNIERNKKAAKKFIKESALEKIGKGIKASTKEWGGEMRSLALYEIPVVKQFMLGAGGVELGKAGTEELLYRSEKILQKRFNKFKYSEKFKKRAKVVGAVLGAAGLSLLFSGKAEASEYKGPGKAVFSKIEGYGEEFTKDLKSFGSIGKGKWGVGEFANNWWGGFKGRHKVGEEGEKWFEKREEGKIIEEFSEAMEKVKKDLSSKELLELNKLIPDVDSKSDLTINDLKDSYTKSGKKGYETYEIKSDLIQQAKENAILQEATELSASKPKISIPETELPNTEVDPGKKSKIKQEPLEIKKEGIETKKGELGTGEPETTTEKTTLEEKKQEVGKKKIVEPIEAKKTEVVEIKIEGKVDSVWDVGKEIRKELSSEIKLEDPQGLKGQELKNFQSAQETYINDAIKDNISAQIIEQGRNPDLVKRGEKIEVDITKIRESLAKRGIIEKANNLSSENVENILENNQKIEKLVAEAKNQNRRVTSQDIERVTKGESIEDILGKKAGQEKIRKEISGRREVKLPPGEEVNIAESAQKEEIPTKKLTLEQQKKINRLESMRKSILENFEEIEELPEKTEQIPTKEIPKEIPQKNIEIAEKIGGVEPDSFDILDEVHPDGTPIKPIGINEKAIIGPEGNIKKIGKYKVADNDFTNYENKRFLNMIEQGKGRPDPFTWEGFSKYVKRKNLYSEDIGTENVKFIQKHKMEGIFDFIKSEDMENISPKKFNSCLEAINNPLLTSQEKFSMASFILNPHNHNNITQFMESLDMVAGPNLEHSEIINTEKVIEIRGVSFAGEVFSLFFHKEKGKFFEDIGSNRKWYNIPKDLGKSLQAKWQAKVPRR